MGTNTNIDIDMDIRMVKDKNLVMNICMKSIWGCGSREVV